MSHEGIRAFDHRSQAEIDRDKKDHFRKQAENQLLAERKIRRQHGDNAFWDDHAKISTLALELEERAELDRLQKKYKR